MDEALTNGVILAGGLSRRFGGAIKCLAPLAGRPVLAHVIGRARPQVHDVLLNVNGDTAPFVDFGLPLAGDTLAGHAGPLAGILTGLEWWRAHVPACRWVASFSCDAPFIPHDLVERLHAAAAVAGAEIAVAATDRLHPVIGLWSMDIATPLRAALEAGGPRKVESWVRSRRFVAVPFAISGSSERGGSDPFFNINRPADLAEAEHTLGVEPA